MKKNKYASTIIITVVFLFLLVWLTVTPFLADLPGESRTPGNWIRAGYLGLMIVFVAGLIIMIIKIALLRKKELDEEDEDDLGKY